MRLMLFGAPRHLLSLKSNLINAHRDALKANHLSVNSVAKKKKANKLFLPSGDNLLNFSQALHHLITKKWTFELNTVKDIFPVKSAKTKTWPKLTQISNHFLIIAGFLAQLIKNTFSLTYVSFKCRFFVDFSLTKL